MQRNETNLTNEEIQKAADALNDLTAIYLEKYLDKYKINRMVTPMPIQEEEKTFWVPNIENKYASGLLGAKLRFGYNKIFTIDHDTEFNPFFVMLSQLGINTFNAGSGNSIQIHELYTNDTDLISNLPAICQEIKSKQEEISNIKKIGDFKNVINEIKNKYLAEKVEIPPEQKQQNEKISQAITALNSVTMDFSSIEKNLMSVVSMRQDDLLWEKVNSNGKNGIEAKLRFGASRYGLDAKTEFNPFYIILKNLGFKQELVQQENYHIYKVKTDNINLIEQLPAIFQEIKDKQTELLDIKTLEKFEGEIKLIKRKYAPSAADDLDDAIDALNKLNDHFDNRHSKWSLTIDKDNKESLQCQISLKGGTKIEDNETYKQLIAIGIKVSQTLYKTVKANMVPFDLLIPNDPLLIKALPSLCERIIKGEKEVKFNLKEAEFSKLAEPGEKRETKVLFSFDQALLSEMKVRWFDKHWDDTGIISPLKFIKGSKTPSNILEVRKILKDIKIDKLTEEETGALKKKIEKILSKIVISKSNNPKDLKGRNEEVNYLYLEWRDKFGLVKTEEEIQLLKALQGAKRDPLENRFSNNGL